MASDRQLFVDLSHWQGEGGMASAKWTKLRKCGVKAAIIKATQGTRFVDNAFSTNVGRAKRHKMHIGAYHFLDRGSGVAQARHFVRTVKRANGGSLKDVLLVCDVERNPVTKVFPTAGDVRDFLREVGRLAKRNTLLVYTAEGAWRAIGNPDVTSLCDGLWQARWDGKRHQCQKPNLPAKPPRAGFGGWRGRPRFWQFGAFHYGSHSIDGNAFYGSAAKMRDLFETSKPAKPVPEPPPPPQGFRAAYNARIGEMEAAIAAAPPPTTPGASEATEDALASLAALRIGGG